MNGDTFMMRRLLLLSIVTLSLAACSSPEPTPPAAPEAPTTPETPEPTDVVTITLDSIGSTAWYTVSVEGAQGVSELGEENANATWNLSVGTRYKIINDSFENPDSGAIDHPFELHNPMGEALTSQLGAGSLEADQSINYEEAEDGSSVTFTLTQELADLVASYYCTFHPSMEGEINVQ